MGRKHALYHLIRRWTSSVYQTEEKFNNFVLRPFEVLPLFFLFGKVKKKITIGSENIWWFRPPETHLSLGQKKNRQERKYWNNMLHCSVFYDPKTMHHDPKCSLFNTHMCCTRLLVLIYKQFSNPHFESSEESPVLANQTSSKYQSSTHL